MDDKLILSAIEVEDLNYRFHCASELVRAVHTSITEGCCVPDQDSYDALFGAHLLLHALDSEMRSTVERLWTAVREATKK